MQAALVNRGAEMICLSKACNLEVLLICGVCRDLDKYMGTCSVYGFATF